MHLLFPTHPLCQIFAVYCQYDVAALEIVRFRKIKFLSVNATVPTPVAVEDQISLLAKFPINHVKDGVFLAENGNLLNHFFLYFYFLSSLFNKKENDNNRFMLKLDKNKISWVIGNSRVKGSEMDHQQSYCIAYPNNDFRWNLFA
jgi:hypothetical protein